MKSKIILSIALSLCCSRIEKAFSSDSIFEHTAKSMEVNENGELTIDGSHSIEVGAFSGNSKLKKVTISGDVSRIGDAAFSRCKELHTVIITSNALTNIGSLAFSDCPELKTIQLPDNLEFIGPLSFRGCPKLDRKPLKKFKGPHLRGKVNSKKYNMFKRKKVRKEYEALSLIQILLNTIEKLKGQIGQIAKDVVSGNVQSTIERAAGISIDEATKNPEIAQMVTGMLNEQGINVDSKTVSSLLDSYDISGALKNGDVTAELQKHASTQE